MTRASRQYPVPFHRWCLAAMTLLTAGGIAASIHLTRIHYLVHTDPGFQSGCAVSQEVNCESVALSPYAVFLGVPVSVWGMAGYAALLLPLAVAWRQHRAGRAALTAATAAVATLFAAVSAVMGGISHFVVHAWCQWCMVTYGINFLLALVAWTRLVRTGVPLSMAVAADGLLAVRYRWLVPGMVAIPLAAGAFFWVQDRPYWQGDLVRVQGHQQGDEHYLGASNPRVTILEFTDYQCPFCRRAHQQLRAVFPRFADRVRLVHKHFPLDDACNPLVTRPFHRFACRFSQAAACAGRQGKFWEMNDALFSAQDTQRAEDVDVMALARRIGLDMGRFRRCMDGPLPPEVRDDIAEGRRRKIHATPTFVVGDKVFTGHLDAKDIAAALQ